MPESISSSVGGALVSVISEFTRPANATAYTAGDVVSNSISATTLLAFTKIFRQAGGSGYVVKARLHTDLKTEVAQYRLYLYSVSETSAGNGAPTVTVPVDNAADTNLYANRTHLAGYIDFPACASGADTANNTGAYAVWNGTPLPVHAYGGSGGGAAGNIAASASLYGKLVNMTGTTPASGQNFSVSLTVDQN